MTKNLIVRSNVRRDLLQNAALFRNEKLVIWEYVSNSLQYVDPGVNPEVYVTIDSRGRQIIITDNGRGMDLNGLQNFFVMHGENLDRAAGRPGRGRFGTGKSAAFGIARRLRVTSVRNSQRYQVELTREAIEGAGDHEIPLDVIEAGVATDEPNGTVVEIEEIHLRRLDLGGVLRYVERHLARWRGRPRVAINEHDCEPREPVVSRRISRRPDGDVAEALGDVELVLKVATAPLDPEQQGVSIYANGVWLETTLCGLEGQPMGNYIFGEIEVPRLDREEDPIPAYDMSRSMQLNRSNPTVQALVGFLGREIDQLRRELVSADRERRAAAEARRLQHEADQIADLINQDFAAFSARLQRMRARGGRGRDKKRIPVISAESDILFPQSEGDPGSPLSDSGGPRGTERTRGPGGSDLEPILERDPAGAAKGTPSQHGQRTRTGGGFRVEFEHLGDAEHRAKYVRESRIILVNLDHAQIKSALGAASVEDVNFRRLAYEVAFNEYALALASELASSGDYLDITDPIFEIRETVNRMANRAANLYAAFPTSGSSVGTTST